MKIIGLTGGIASGKSTVSMMLRNLGCEIIDADLIAREVVGPGSETLKRMVQTFGEIILNGDGTLNRKALGNIVFNDKSKLKSLNDLMHPVIRETILMRIKDCRENDENRIIIVDAAVLIESGMDDIVDEVWLVYADPDIQLKRLIKRDGIGTLEAEARIKSQMSVKDKIKKSDRIIDNSRSIEHTKDQVIKLWNDTNK